MRFHFSSIQIIKHYPTHTHIYTHLYIVVIVVVEYNVERKFCDTMRIERRERNSIETHAVLLSHKLVRTMLAITTGALGKSDVFKR